MGGGWVWPRAVLELCYDEIFPPFCQPRQIESHQLGGGGDGGGGINTVYSVQYIVSTVMIWPQEKYTKVILCRNCRKCSEQQSGACANARFNVATKQYD